MSQNQRAVVITGGAGYIGRCLAFQCEQEGLTPIVVDDFSTSHPGPHLDRWEVIRVDLTKTEEISAKLKSLKKIHAIFHLAARALVPESCEKPELYFRNNLLSTINIAEWAAVHSVPHFIHSSSCAVYGVPSEVPISESTPLMPISPYGETKLIAERILSQFETYRGLKLLQLRYFNPAGSVDGGRLGEDHQHETHLIPNLVKACLAGKPITIFGTDYPTPDGTCIRDFIHIEDLVQAHVLALSALELGKNLEGGVLNLGSGSGTSIRQVVDAAGRVFGKKPGVEEKPRRSGDPAALVANPSRAQRVLNWKTTKSIDDMIRDHLLFEKMRLVHA